jgi:translation elongation factor Ts
MSKIDVKTIQLLREATGAGLMDVKRALEESGGDFDKAVELLKKWGIAKGEKKVARETRQGNVFYALDENGKWGALVEVGCETDFVARTEDFQNFGNFVLKKLLQKKTNDINALLDNEVEEEMKALAGKVGENIQVKRCAYFETADGLIYIYVHPGNMLAAMVEVYPPSIEIAKESAMQIAAMSPLAISENDFPKEVLEAEKKIYEEQARESGKPENVVQKIVEGKMRAFIKEKTLLNQPYIRDNNVTFGEWLKSQGEYTIRRFVRFMVGEE